MDDLDLYTALSRDPERLEAAKLFRARLHKTAGIKDWAREALKETPGIAKNFVTKDLPALARANKPEIIGGTIGGLVGGGAGYVSAKRRKKDKPSLFEQDAAKLHQSHKEESKRLRTAKAEPGLTHKIKGVSAKAMKDLAAIATRHPVAYGVAAGMALSGVGAHTGRAVANIAHRLGGSGLEP